MKKPRLLNALIATLFCLAPAICWADAIEKPAAPKSETAAPNPADKTPGPAPLSGNVKKGLDYLVEHQDASGGWGQGGGWRQSGQGGGRVEGQQVKDPPDVGSTCIAILALVRSGSTPKTGPYATHITKGVEYVLGQVEHADDKSVYVTDIRDTQLQVKIGRYVDTFLTGLVLSELKGHMSDEKRDARVAAALAKTIKKIELNQNADGTFAGNTGWASVLSQGLCSKALNRAKGAGVAVNEETLKRDYNQALAALESKTAIRVGAGVGGSASGTTGLSGKLAVTAPAAPEAIAPTIRPSGPVSRPATAGSVKSLAEPSDAGVKIYHEGANTSRLDEFAQGNKQEKAAAEAIVQDSTAPAPAKVKAQAKLAEIAGVEKSQQAAVDGIMRKLDDKSFIQGFGNNGGEEYLSYMNISETLAGRGGAEWERWNKNIALSINRVQNQDGSWSGDHCITGRTFCTGAALLTLMADRAPTAMASRAQVQK